MHTLASLARHRVGDIIYLVRLAPRRPGGGEPECGWGAILHPKFLFDRKLRATGFLLPKRLPRLPCQDGDYWSITHLLTSKLVVQPFPVDGLMRDRNSGELFYSSHEEWVPESCLLDSEAAAHAELQRIKRLLRLWLDDQL